MILSLGLLADDAAEISLIGHVIPEHIKDKLLLDGLPHCVVLVEMLIDLSILLPLLVTGPF